MSRKTSLFSIFMLLIAALALLALASPVAFAQDDPVGDPTVWAGTPGLDETALPPLTPIDDPVPDTDVPLVPVEPPSGIHLSAVEFIGIILVTFAGGAFTLGPLAARLHQNPQAVKTAEALGNSVPESVAIGLIKLIDNITPLLNFAREAFDRVPADSKPTAQGVGTLSQAGDVVNAVAKGLSRTQGKAQHIDPNAEG